MDQIESDWILWLDAGETLSPDSTSALRAFVDGEAKPDHAYMLMIVVPSADPSSSAEQAARIRLVPNHSELRYRGRVREDLNKSLELLDLSVDMAPGRIQRHRRENLPARKAEKARRNLRIVSAEYQGSGNLPVRLLLAAAEAFSDLQEVEKARQAFLQATQQAERGSTEHLDAYYGLLTTFDGIPELQDQQLTVGLEALEIFPSMRNFCAPWEAISKCKTAWIWLSDRLKRRSSTGRSIWKPGTWPRLLKWRRFVWHSRNRFPVKRRRRGKSFWMPFSDFRNPFVFDVT